MRVLRLEVSVWISKPSGRGHGFLSGFPPFSFTVYNNARYKNVRGFMSLKKQKAAEVTLNSKEENFSLDFGQEFGLKLKNVIGCMLYVVFLLSCHTSGLFPNSKNLQIATPPQTKTPVKTTFRDGCLYSCFVHVQFSFCSPGIDVLPDLVILEGVLLLS